MRSSLTILLALVFSCGRSQDLGLYAKKTYTVKDFTLPYRLLLPQNFDSSRKYPLLVFLHGAYEKGSDNERQLEIGGRYFLRQNNRDSFPAIILFPQCPPNESWAYFDTEMDSATGKVQRLTFPFRRQPTPVSGILMRLVDSLRGLQYVNNKRVYIAGLSQGGMGVLDLIARNPETFAAGLSICGAGDVSTCKKFAGKVALWLFHGSSDDVLPVSFSREFLQAFEEGGV